MNCLRKTNKKYRNEETLYFFQKLGINQSFSGTTLIRFTIDFPFMETLFLRGNFILKQFVGMKVCLGLLCVVALILVPLQMVTAFEINVGLYDAKIDSGKVKVSVSSQTTNKEKSRILDVGKITSKSGDSRIENIIFKFSERNFRLMEHFLRVCIQIFFMQINVNMRTDIITLDQRAYG